MGKKNDKKDDDRFGWEGGPAACEHGSNTVVFEDGMKKRICKICDTVISVTPAD